MSNNRLDEVKSSFEQQDNFAQAIFSVYGQYLGFDRDTCLKITSVFGGGINRTGNVCGAVTGALMVIGLKYGEVGIKNPLKPYEVASEFIEKFKDRNKTILCRELFNHDLLTDEDLDHAYKTDTFNNCPKFVNDAAEILEKML